MTIYTNIENDSATYYKKCYERIYSQQDSEDYIPLFYKLQWVLTLDNRMELYHFEKGLLLEFNSVMEWLEFDTISSVIKDAPIVDQYDDSEINISFTSDYTDVVMNDLDEVEIVNQRKIYGFQQKCDYLKTIDFLLEKNNNLC